MSCDKACAAHEVERFGKVLFRLAGKADDDVAGELHAGYRRTQVVEHLHGAVGVVFAAHCRKRARAAALERYVKMRRNGGKA